MTQTSKQDGAAGDAPQQVKTESAQVNHRLICCAVRSSLADEK